MVSVVDSDPGTSLVSGLRSGSPGRSWVFCDVRDQDSSEESGTGRRKTPTTRRSVQDYFGLLPVVGKRGGINPRVVLTYYQTFNGLRTRLCGTISLDGSQVSTERTKESPTLTFIERKTRLKLL